MRPTERAEQLADDMLNRILELYALTAKNWELRAADIDTAYACRDPVTKARVIYYNESIMKDAEDLREQNGSSYLLYRTEAILAHEIGHHQNDHRFGKQKAQRQKEEAQADLFAGMALYRLGASEEHTVKVFRSLRAGGESHPPAQAREEVARRGWLLGHEQEKYLNVTGPIVDDSRDADSHKERKPQDETTIPTLSHLTLLANDSEYVIHTSGQFPSGPGVGFSLQGQLEFPASGSLRVSVRFSHSDGGALSAHRREAHYRTSTGQVATASRPYQFEGGELDLATIAVDSIPYYALNLIPTGFEKVYSVMARATVFLSDAPVAETKPIEVVVRW